MKVILHADDFCYNKEISEDILDCAREGTLHGISIMPNSKYFDECMDMLKESGLELDKTIHFCISEGLSISDKKDIPLLVNDRGMFKLSFFKLLIMSIGPKRNELRKQLRIELKAQYDKALPYLDKVNIDSHVHYHMIPLVMDELLSIVEASNREIGYLRVPAEPITPFIKNARLYKSYSLENLIKNVVLNFLYLCNKKRISRYSKNTAVFFGIMLSGHMDIDRVSRLLPAFMRIAEKRSMNLEVLAHPGRARSKESVLDPYNEEYMKAPLSENRHIEKDMFMNIGKYLK